MNPASNVELALITGAVDRLAFDVLQHKVGLSTGSYACIQQLGDVWIGEPRQDCAFSFESLAAATHQTRAQKLHCRFALESPVISFRKPHRTHAAMSDGGEIKR